MKKFKKILICIVAAAAVSLTANAAMAQCRGGACGSARVGQKQYWTGLRKENRVGSGRVGAVATAPIRAVRGLLGRTRFFDGDGRPFRRAR